MDSPKNEVTIEDRLREVYEKTDCREYAEALDALEMARSEDPGNIYLSALKRQLDALLSFSQADELSEDQRHELMEPMPGIIECAIRDHIRQYRSRIADLPPDNRQEVAPDVPASAYENDSAPAQSADPGDVQKELETLKLLYFQRASKFVMKGEYEQALAEVRRVFVVDPENTIAKEYASRVEHLIQHAPPPAVDPMTTSDSVQDSPQTIQVDLEPTVEEPPHVHAERSTAWNDDFLSPKSSTRIPEHRLAPPSSRQTVAYGDSLALSLSSTRSGETEDRQRKPARKKSKLFPLLAAVILVPLLVGGAVAIFSGKNAGTPARNPLWSRQPQSVTPALAAEATTGARTDQEPAQSSGIHEPRHVAPPAPDRTPPTAGHKSTTEPAPMKTDVPLQPAPAEGVLHEPVKVAAQSPVSTQPPPSAAAESAPSTPNPPAFIPVEKEPQIVRLERPEFPNFVWKMGIEGQVVVRVLIDANGKPLDSQILKSTNPVFEQPVIDAVMKSQFNPAQMGQGPVAAWLTIPFRFKQPK
jgi:protein TonB